MLVLSRKQDESIIVGSNVEICVVDIRGDKVRLGIEAPRDVSVHRKEVVDAIRRDGGSVAPVGTEAQYVPVFKRRIQNVVEALKRKNRASEAGNEFERGKAVGIDELAGMIESVLSEAA